MAGGFAVGSAMLAPVEVRHDRQTARRIAEYKARLDAATDAEVLDAVAALERPQARQHPLCAELRAIADAELRARHLSLASMAGGVA